MTTREKRTFVSSPAKLEGIRGLIGCFGKSGGGKTRSALILARGMVGPKGKICVLDTENKRARIFANKIPGGYDTIDLDPPFSPDLYSDALDHCADKYDLVVIDSMSHEWEGEGGVLDMQEEELSRMAGDNWSKREACKMAAWIKPKAAHKRMMQSIIRYPLPLIVCLRAQEKTHISKKKEGERTQVYTDEFTTPIADPRFIFEMLVNLEVFSDDQGRGGFCHIRKITIEDLYPCLPKQGEQLNYEHGEKLAAFLRGGSLIGGKSAPASGKAQPDERVKLLTELRDATTSVHGWKKEHGSGAWPAAKAKLSQHLIDEMILSDTESLDEIPADRLKTVLETVRAKQHQQ